MAVPSGGEEGRTEEIDIQLTGEWRRKKEEGINVEEWEDLRDVGAWEVDLVRQLVGGPMDALHCKCECTF